MCSDLHLASVAISLLIFQLVYFWFGSTFSTVYEQQGCYKQSVHNIKALKWTTCHLFCQTVSSTRSIMLKKLFRKYKLVSYSANPLRENQKPFFFSIKLYSATLCLIIWVLWSPTAEVNHMLPVQYAFNTDIKKATFSNFI